MELVELTPGFAGIFRWQEQYFEDHTVPDDVVVSLDDSLSWVLYPHHRWVYNKMLIDLRDARVSPRLSRDDTGLGFPVFSKPIYNMNGMGTGSRLVADEQEYLSAIEPGHFWMPLFKGRHVSSDVALEKGKPRWWQQICHRCAS
jgi:hypothetical protein